MFKIYTSTKTRFGFWDRIRILFGKRFHTRTTIYVDKEVSIVKPSLTDAYVSKFFPKKIQLESKP